MAWWIQPLEIKDEHGQPSGQWRLTATSDEDGGGPYPLCACEGGHDSAAAAQECPEAQRCSRTYG